MTRRIAATKELLRMSVMSIQFVAGVRFLAGLFDSDETVRMLWESVSKTFGQMSAVFPGTATDANGPPEALFLTLGFMGFGYILFVVVPGTVARMEKGKGFFSEN